MGVTEPMQSLIPQPPAPLRLLMVGLNHKSAPLELRERLAFTPDQAAAAARSFREQFPRAELVILSTCNRVEFYLARPLRAAPTLEELSAFLADFHNAPAASLLGHIYHRQDKAMAEHLFLVTASLDSMVVGETQILAQVKDAYHQATRHEEERAGQNPDAEPASRVLHVLFQRALAAAKEVHQRTQLSAGRLSVASVAVELAASVFDRFDDKTVLCIGAGKMSALMLRHLADLKPNKLLITNRSPDRAAELAKQFNATAVPFEQLDDLLVEADLLLTGTGAPDPIITEARFKALQKRRRYRPIVMMDVAVPRDIEPSVAKLANVYLYNIDDLQEVAAGNRGKRDTEIAAAKLVIETHVEEFLRWFAARDVGPLVKALYEKSHALAKAELEALFTRNPDMPEKDRAELERLAHRLVGKLLHDPVKQLTTHTESTARPTLAAALQKLFNLENKSP